MLVSIVCQADLHSILKSKSALFEMFSELNDLNMIFSLDFKELKTLLKAMAPTKLAVEVLSKQDSTLLTTDTAIEFAYRKLVELQ